MQKEIVLKNNRMNNILSMIIVSFILIGLSFQIKYFWIPILLLIYSLYVWIYDNPYLIIKNDFMLYKNQKNKQLHIIKYDDIKKVEIGENRYGNIYLYIEYFYLKKTKLIQIQIYNGEKLKDVCLFFKYKQIEIKAIGLLNKYDINYPK